MILYGERVLLRAMEPEDMEMYRDMVNDPEIERMIGGWSFPVSALEQRQWYERAVVDKRNLRFTIESLEASVPLGMVSLTQLDWKNRTATLAIKLSQHTPKRLGYGTDSYFTLIKYAFEELGLHRLNGSALDYNTPSLSLAAKCGAKREGVARSAVYKNGAYHDIIYYGFLYEDFLDALRKAGWQGGGPAGGKDQQP